MRQKRETHRALWAMLRYVGNGKLIAAMMAGSVLQNARDLACIVALAYATDQVLLGGNIGLAVLLMLITMFCGAPTCALRKYLGATYHLKSQKKLQRGMAQRIEGLPLGWVESHKSGEILSTYTADMELICGWMSGTFPAEVHFVTYMIGALAYSLSQSVLLTIAVFPVIILIVPFLTKLAKPLQKTSDVQRTAAADSIADMQEVLADPAYLKAYCLENAMEQRIETALETKKRAEQKGGFYFGMVQALGILGSYLPGFVAAAVGVLFLRKGMITAGFLVGFVQMVVQRFGQTLPQVGEFATANNKAGASAKRVMKLLHLPQERKDGEKSIPSANAVLALEDVTFCYQEEKSPALRHVNLKVEQGETVALVGSSGSGKSTVIKLLMGLYEAQQGSVNVLGRDVKQWELETLRGLMAPVFQEAALFPASVRDNIAEETVADEQIWTALQHADLKEFVAALPEGLDTPVGERGVTLSGGQQQRLTIARALIKDAPVILLDEPTSALDTVTENEFQKAFEQLKQGKTTVVVAHRLQTIRSADRIYVFDHGTVVQEGTHASLIAQPGVYRRLYQSQLEESGVR